VVEDEDALDSFAARVAEALIRAKVVDDAAPRDADIRKAG
jgi:hypothetical protein